MSHLKLKFILSAAFAAAFVQLYSQTPGNYDCPVCDTVVVDTLVSHIYERDTTDVQQSGTEGVIKNGNNNGRLVRLLRESFTVDLRERSKQNKQIVDEAEILGRYNGKVVNSISYERHDVFEDSRTWLRRLGNGMHMRTTEGAICRDLLFRMGDRFDAETAVASNRIIQSRHYISDSRLVVELNPDDTTRVDVTVVTFDNWTIGGDGELFSGHRGMFYIYDYNFLGMGNNVGLKSYANYGDMRYLGSVADYTNPNFVGTFYRATMRAGHNFDNSYLEFGLSKDFLLPNDYEAGASFSQNKIGRFKVCAPDTIAYYNVDYRWIDAWGGWSKHVEQLGASYYITGHFASKRFQTRPETTAQRMHPLFHNRDEIMFGTGLYWERFYSSNMIYGYGFQEYIASGHKFQLTGGYSWQEFDDYWYAGITTQKGGFTSFGYILGRMTAGSYINSRNGSLWQTSLNINTLWFSNLWGNGRAKVRQFITLDYTRGWNRGEGAGSLLMFTDEICPTSFNAYTSGSNRLLLNTETVVFTPFNPLGFRIALFGFADVGTIGNDRNPFVNDFYSTFGLGIRFKNERLVFSAFQLRLGFAVGKNGMLNNKMFSGSIERRIDQHRFIPTRPEVAVYE